MNKIWLIIQREYWTRVRKKSFLLVTLLFPILLVSLGVGAGLIATASKKEKKIAIKDEGNFFGGTMEDRGKIHFAFETAPLEELQKNYKQMGYMGIIYVPSNLSLKYLKNINQIQFYTNEVLGVDNRSVIQSAVEDRLRDYLVRQANIDQDFFKQLNDLDVSLNVNDPSKKDAGDKSLLTIIATVIGYFSGLIVYATLFIYGVSVMRGVMEEKANRIVEIMSSSVKPFQMMLGKVIGIGTVGLTQFAIWIIVIIGAYFVVGVTLGPELAMHSPSTNGTQQEMMQQANQFDLNQVMDTLQQISWVKFIFCFLWYFLGGYMLYGALYAAMGSTMGEDSTDQQSALSFIVGLPIIISFFIMMSIVNDPNSSLAVWASIIPFSSPIIMPARLAFDPPMWQLVLSMVMLVLGFLFTIWIAGKIYRTGILLYGKKVTLKEIGHWVFLKS